MAARASKLGAQSIEVEYNDERQWVLLRRRGVARELLNELFKAELRQLRIRNLVAEAKLIADARRNERNEQAGCARDSQGVGGNLNQGQRCCSRPAR